MSLLEIVIPDTELFVESENRFINVRKTKLTLEHSLISVKKWESKWHKAFLGDDPKTNEEIYDYIRCMTIGNCPDNDVYRAIPPDGIENIMNYIGEPMTATRISKSPYVGASKVAFEIITNEIIYYWMIELGVPMEFEKWHLNQLLMLIKVVSIKKSPKKKMGRLEEAQQRSAINKYRRAKYNSKG